MSENSKIDWLTRTTADGRTVTGATFNPWLGCSHALYTESDGKAHVHPGCVHCYAEEMMANRYKRCVWGSNGTRVVAAESGWAKLPRWNRRAEKAGIMLPVFPSLCDPFENWDRFLVDAKGGTLFEPTGNITRIRPMTLADVRRRLFSAIDTNRSLLWMLFTKRPQNVRRMWGQPADLEVACHHPATFFTEELKSRGWTIDDVTTDETERLALRLWCAASESSYKHRTDVRVGDLVQVIAGAFGTSAEVWTNAEKSYLRAMTIERPNVHLYYSASNQATLDYGVPLLLESADLVPVLGISAEPLLGPMDLRRWIGGRGRIGHVIIGVESNGPRVGRLGEFRSESQWWNGAIEIIEQCKTAEVPVYVKQGPINGRVSHDPAEWPDEARVREFPGR